ncbi:sugar-binding domain-containing protein [Labilibaculum antarcticum]|nr:sugar-binding domain-containing protein [Labilibaculum antarcticum]
MKRLNLLLIIFMCLLGACAPIQKSQVDLSGEWAFQLDPENVGVQQSWFNQDLKDQIKLPGTTDEAGYGEKTSGSDYGILTRVHKYIGAAWYQREIEIPEEWKDKEITLLLERVLWQSKIYVDGKELSTKDALATPHVHHLGVLKEGKHRLTLRIDNSLIRNMGDKGHAYGEYTQSIWNGVVGKIELQARNDLNIESIRTFPYAENNQLELDVKLSKTGGLTTSLEVKVFDTSNNKLLVESLVSVTDMQQQVVIPITNKIKLWNEFNPAIYRLEATLKDGESVDTYETNFGFSKVSASKSHVLINGESVFLRGNLDCVHFPLTGYPSMDVEGWKRIFRIYKEYGLNHVRFHSWCPPEAAFTAADELGIYIQAEASTWIDWWMALSKEESKDRPEMYTQGEPKGLGPDNPDASEFVKAEINRVLDTYGNHPSFILFCIGNELGNSDFDVMGEWMRQAKEKDSRRLYAASTARTVTPNCEYSATHSYPGIGGVRQHMTNNNNWDYEKNYGQTPVPVIAHEIGQWPVYPEWKEIDKYTGVLRARNLEGFREQAKKNGVFSQDKELHQASGKLSVLLYKDEIESFMRTPSCAGIQLLSMQDYQGQGEALIGWLDCFYDSKGIVTPEEFRQFSNTIVPLVKLPSYTFWGGDSLKSEVLLHHFGEADLNNQSIRWSLVSDIEEELLEGVFSAADYQKGTLLKVGVLEVKLPDVKKASQYTLQLSVQGTEFVNAWHIWIYPKQLDLKQDDILITESLNSEAFNKLEQGGKVLLLAHQCGDPANTKFAAWKPLYWSASFFPGQSIETLGLIVQDKHPAFADFPTENYNDWQWWNICKGAHGFALDSFPEDYKSIAQPVGDFHYNHKLGSIFELKYGKGKLLVCGYDLSESRTQFPEVRQLKYSLLNYMKSDLFHPNLELDRPFLTEKFKKFELATSLAPKGFEEAILYVKSAAKMKKNGNSSWAKETDQVVIANKVDYKIEKGNSYKDEQSSCWVGSELEILIKTPEGIKGEFYVFFHDWNNQGRKGVLNFEGRDYILGAHSKEGEWVKLNVMREDSNDGKLILKAKCTRGGNLMISAIAYITKN